MLRVKRRSIDPGEQTTGGVARFARAMAVALALAGCSPPPADGTAWPARFSARVLHVEDGDTVLVEGGQHVRYLGIDAPEKDEPFHREATAENRRLVEGKTVEVARGGPEERDRYGRLLAVVSAANGSGAASANEALVRAGLASVYVASPGALAPAYLETLLRAQREAIASRRGFWALRLAVEPAPGTLVSTRFRVHRSGCPDAQAGSPRPVTSLISEMEKGKSLCRSCKPLESR